MRIVLCGDSGASLQTLRACSACAGDYEDPDRTAWTWETEEDETHAEAPARTRPPAGTQERAENAGGDERMIEEGADDDEFPAKEA